MAPRRTTLSLLTAIGASILILNSEPNARYVYAAMPLLFIPYAGVLGWLQRNQRGLTARRWDWRWFAARSTSTLCPVPAGTIRTSTCRHRSHRRTGALYARVYSHRSAIRRFNDVHPGSALFLGAEEDVADSRGDVYEAHWHQYFFLLQLREARTLPVMKRLFEKWGVRYLRPGKPHRESDRTLNCLRSFSRSALCWSIRWTRFV